MAITVIDAPCGTGKTEYAIRYMNEDKDNPFLYIAPLREMFERIRSGIKGRSIYTPDTDNPGRTKLFGIKELIDMGVDIMSTHALFLRLDDQAIQILQERKYRLIIDEALDVVSVLPSKSGKRSNDDECNFQELKQNISAEEVGWFQENNLIEVDADNYNQIVWTGQGDADHRYKDVERIIRTGAMSYVDNSYLVWSLPIAVLNAFDDITILTYRFSSSVFRGYLDFWDKSYEHKTVVRNGDMLRLAEFSPELEKGNVYASLINICDIERLNAIGIWKKENLPFSSRWYSNKSNREKMKVLKDNTTNYFRHYCGADRDSIMWTTFKKYANKLCPKGYTKRTDGTPTLVSCNCRATENYKDRYTLAYLIDRHLHPGIKAYLAQRTISIDNDEYALSELIQWIFRSQIRKGDPVNIYLPSERMRKLLMEWIGCEVPLRKTLSKRR